MTETINQNNMSNNKRSKVSFFLFAICLLLLIGIGGYFVYANGSNKTTELTKNDVASNVTESSKTSNKVEDTTTTSNTTDQSPTTTTDQTTRDPNRYYNDKDGYSFVMPKGYAIRPISEIPGFKDELNSYEYGLDTSFDYKYTPSDDPDSNPDIWLLINRSQPVKKIDITDSKDCQNKLIRDLEVIKCSYENELLGGNSISAYIYSKDKYFYIASHSNYQQAFDQIINSFEWL